MNTVLTIAGSDPSGGAGVQADLKTFSQLKVYGMAVIAALTAQNTLGVSAVAEVAPDFVAQQLEAVLTDIPPDSVKTGMLLSPEVIRIVARKVIQHGIRNLVVDPVMISTSGARLIHPDAVATLRRALLPHALLVTPNLSEAAALSESSVRTVEDMERAAAQIHDMGPSYVLVKGGHLESEDATDVLFNGKEFVRLPVKRVATNDTHGTGCVLSASIAAYLALGESVERAVVLAKEFVTNAIRNALRIGKGIGPCNPIGG